MKGVYIVDYFRTPVGRYGGVLSNIRPDDLLVVLLKSLISRFPEITPDQIDEVIIGCANQAGEDNRNIARLSSLIAGLPVSVPGYTVNRLCASGMQAIVDGAAHIATGFAELIVAGGVESMSRAPWVMLKPDKAFSRSPQLVDTSLGWRFVNPAYLAQYNALQMGETAEFVAAKYNISRHRQDVFALSSHQKYWQSAAFWQGELLPVTLPNGEVVKTDEAPRKDTSLEKLANLKAAFQLNGSVTAGNAAGLNDGASLMLLASEKAVKQYHLQPLARIVGYASAGVHPDEMGIGPVAATRKLLKQQQIKIGDIDAVELNEAYASQVLASIDALEIEEKKVNRFGGAIAIGHPLGSSGTRITGTLMRTLASQKLKYGLATMCVGVGQGMSLLLENTNQ